MKEEGIRHLRIPVPAHKSTNVVIPVEVIGAVLGVLEDPRNHPVLVHCNKGKVSSMLLFLDASLYSAFPYLHFSPLRSPFVPFYAVVSFAILSPPSYLPPSTPPMQN